MGGRPPPTFGVAAGPAEAAPVLKLGAGRGPRQFLVRTNDEFSPFVLEFRGAVNGMHMSRGSSRLVNSVRNMSIY